MKTTKPFPNLSLRRAVVAGFAAMLLLTGCSSQTDPQPAPQPATESEVAAEDTGQIHIHDAWIKAAESGMTGAFGVIENESDTPVTVTAVNTPVSDVSELHITADNGAGSMVMQEAPDGFTVEPGASFVLEPGGNHLMLMELNQPIAAGDEVVIELVLSDGTTVDFVAAAKDFSGANENYDPGTKNGEEGDTDHDH